MNRTKSNLAISKQDNSTTPPKKNLILSIPDMLDYLNEVKNNILKLENVLNQTESSKVVLKKGT